MLVTKGAASDGIGLVLALLVSVTEGETVDEVDGGRALTDGRLLVLEVVGVVAADLVDVLLCKWEGKRRVSD